MTRADLWFEALAWLDLSEDFSKEVRKDTFESRSAIKKGIEILENEEKNDHKKQSENS